MDETIQSWWDVKTDHGAAKLVAREIMHAQQWHRTADSVTAVQEPGRDARWQEHSAERGSGSGQAGRNDVVHAFKSEPKTTY